MKKLTNLLMVCSLALAGAAMAQQPDAQSTPKKKQAVEKGHAAVAKPAANAAKPPAAAMKQHEAPKAPVAAKVQKAPPTPKAATSAATTTKISGQPDASATLDAKERRKGMKPPPANAKIPPSAAPATAAAASAAQPLSPASQPKAQANTAAAAKKPDVQQMQQIKAQHTNFHAQAKPEQVPAVTFTQNYRIHGSDQWQGRQYEAFRSYHPERHDERWYHSRYNRVELIGGGYYYLNNGYWYPAWGYNPSAEYYAYDAPIYVGHSAEPPDKVIANVQGALQQMGYYKGEVDGLLGPLTRQAITDYQTEQGLTATAVIDEPTLDSLGMGES